MDGNAEVIGAYAWAHEMSSGKDTPSGHWEIAGVPVLFEWGYFSDHENSFPQELLDKLVERANLPGYLGTGLVIIIIWADAICMLVGGVAMMIVVFSCTVIKVTAICISSAGMGERDNRKAQQQQKKE